MNEKKSTSTRIYNLRVSGLCSILDVLFSYRYKVVLFLVGFIVTESYSFGQGPVGVNSGIAFWLDASDLDGDGVVEGLGESGLIAGDSVVAWEDKSGVVSIPFAPFGSYGGPTYIPSDAAFGGRAVLDFTNTTVLFADPPTSWTTSHTVFVVFKQKASPVGDGTTIFTNGIGLSNDPSMDDHLRIGSDSIGATTDNFAYHTSTGTGSTPVPTDYVYGLQADAVSNSVIYSVTTSATDVTTYVNGSQTSTGSWGGSGNTFDKYLLNINRDTSIVNEAYIAEIIVYQEVLSPAQMRRVHDYLDCKYLGTSVGAAPGGIEPCYLSLWLKADAGVTTDGSDDLTDWQDQGNFNFDGTTSGGDRPHFLEMDNNYNPAFEFDGNDEEVDLENSSASDELTIGTSDFTIYAVASTQGPDGTLFADNRCLDENGYKIQYDNTSSSWEFEGATFTSPPTIADSATVKTSNTSTPYSLIRMQREGVNVTALSNEGDAGSGNSTTSLLFSPNNGEVTERWIGSQRSCGGSAENYFEGNFSEIIVVRSTVSAIEDAKIQSYLGLKYGLTIDQPTVTDYRASDDTTIIWDDVSYWNRVIGIAQDDGSGLDQKISKSQDPSAIITIATTNDFSTANADVGRTSLGDGSFFVCGNDGIPATSWVAGPTAPAQYAINSSTWKVKETGVVGAVYLQVDVEDAQNNIPGFLGSLYLVTGSDLSLATPVAMTETATDIWTTVTPVNFVDGNLFSFAVKNDFIVEFTHSAQSSADENPITAADFADVIGSGTVNVATSFTVVGADAGAINPNDYIYTNQTFTVSTGTFDKDTFFMVQPTLVQDFDIEGNENIQFTISPAVGTAVANADSTGGTNSILIYTITDDDSYNISIGTPVDGEEGSTNVTFQIFIVGGGVNVSGGAIQGDIAWSGTADEGAGLDYTGVPNFSIPIGVDTILITVPVLDDNLLEGTETVVADITPTTSGVVAQVSSASANIIDDEFSDIYVSIGSPVDAAEGSNIEFTISLPSGINNETGTPLTGNLTYTAGTAVNTNDFSGTTGFTINPGSNFTTISFLAINDVEVENTETVIAEISGLNIGMPDPAATTSTANITDPDSAALTISISSPVTGVVEGVSDIIFNITMDGGLINGTGTDITGTLDLSGGTASAPLDFTDIISFSIPDGSGSTSITVMVTNDVIPESTENVVATISNLNYGMPNATNNGVSVNIFDDDAGGVLISITQVVDTVAEDAGTPLTFDIYIEGGANNTTLSDITGNITYLGAANAPADFGAVLSFAIPPGSNSTTIDLNVVNDGATEPTEDVVVILNGTPTVGGSAGAYANFQSTGWILDDDASNLTMSIGSPVDGQEAGDSVSFVVSLDLFATNNTGTAITGDVLYSGTAQASDYDLVSMNSTTFSIPDGASQTTVVVPINDDNSVEYTETLLAVISNASLGSVSSADSAIANVLDNDFSSLTLSLSGAVDGVEGGNDVQFLVEMNNGYTNGLGVPLAFTVTFAGTATAVDDYSTIPYEIPMGDNFVNIDVEVIDDANLELTETVIGTLVSASEGAISATTFIDTALIDDNDLANAVLQITATDAVEMPIPHNPVFIVSFVGGLQNETGSPITGTISLSGTATEGTGNDYAGVFAFSIQDGSSQQLIPFLIEDDLLIENNETIIATISNPSPSVVGISGTNNVATALILDDDTDDDNDGLSDLVDPIVGNIDSDCDGVFDGCDVDADGDIMPDDGGIDLDGNGTPDVFYDLSSIDTDLDGIKDVCDADANGDGVVDNGPDINDDGLNDNEWDPTDDDEDLLPNHVDPNDANIDSDGDGITDGADADVDGDGFLDNGCDMDGDGIHDVADADDDGLPGTDPGNIDSDGDQIDARWDMSDIEFDGQQINYIVSPNGDGVNETLVIQGIQVVERHELIIYNRYGQPVYIDEDYDNNWDGQVNQNSTLGGEKLEDGVYYYTLDVNNDRGVIRGYIEIRK